jgi:hypothetical protein
MFDSRMLKVLKHQVAARSGYWVLLRPQNRTHQSKQEELMVRVKVELYKICWGKRNWGLRT